MGERIANGTQVTWTSQSQGTAKSKTGTVIAFVPAKTYPEVPDSARTAKARWKTCDLAHKSRVDRYLVAVPRPNSREGLVDHYLPNAAWLEK